MIADASRKLLQTQEVVNNITKLDFDKMGAGIYLVSISNDGFHRTFKIQKQ